MAAAVAFPSIVFEMVDLTGDDEPTIIDLTGESDDDDNDDDVSDDDDVPEDNFTEPGNHVDLTKSTLYLNSPKGMQLFLFDDQDNVVMHVTDETGKQVKKIFVPNTSLIISVQLLFTVMTGISPK
jgi:hypothetical protein